MHAAGDTGIEGVDGAKDFDRPFGIDDRGPDQRFFQRAHLIGGITRADIPGGGTTIW